MENLYGQIDLTKLGIIVKAHPELIKEVQFKDGSVHKLIGVNINEKQQADAYGNVAYMKAGIKRANEKEGISYFIGDLKVSQFSVQVQEQPQQQQQQQVPNTYTQQSDLPF